MAARDHRAGDPETVVLDESGTWGGVWRGETNMVTQLGGDWGAQGLCGHSVKFESSLASYCHLMPLSLSFLICKLWAIITLAKTCGENCME